MGLDAEDLGRLANRQQAAQVALKKARDRQALARGTCHELEAQIERLNADVRWAVAGAEALKSERAINARLAALTGIDRSVYVRDRDARWAARMEAAESKVKGLNRALAHAMEVWEHCGAELAHLRMHVLKREAALSAAARAAALAAPSTPPPEPVRAPGPPVGYWFTTPPTKVEYPGIPRDTHDWRTED